MLDPSSLIPSSSVDPIGSLSAFLWGTGGSLAVEIFALNSEMKSKSQSGIPPYYMSPWFWLVRTMVACLAGGLAAAEGATKALIAVNIGASAPAILQLLSGQAPGRNRRS